MRPPPPGENMTNSRPRPDRDSVVDEGVGKTSLPNALSTTENAVTYLVGSVDMPDQRLGEQQC